MRNITIRPAEIASACIDLIQNQRTMDIQGSNANQRETKEVLVSRRHQNLGSRLKKIKQYAAGHLIVNFSASCSKKF